MPAPQWAQYLPGLEMEGYNRDAAGAFLRSQGYSFSNAKLSEEWNIARGIVSGNEAYDRLSGESPLPEAGCALTTKYVDYEYVTIYEVTYQDEVGIWRTDRRADYTDSLPESKDWLEEDIEENAVVGLEGYNATNISTRVISFLSRRT